MFPVPHVGSKIKVRTRYPETYLFAKHKFYENSWEGVVQPNVKGDPDRTIRLRTNDPHHPLTMITFGDNVVALEVDGKPIKAGTKQLPKRDVFTMKIASSKRDRTYTVSFVDGKWHCQCEAFGFGRACRHIKEAQAAHEAKR